MTRIPVLAGNWKMHLTRDEAVALAVAVATHHGDAEHRRCLLFPASVHLEAVAGALAGTSTAIGAQNCHPEPQGAYTGEISLPMLVDLDLSAVLVGHSERRHVFGESIAFATEKVQAVLEHGLNLVLCIGETQEEREAGQTFAVLADQLESLRAVPEGAAERVTVAYEPVWAIGTGLTATPETAQEAHAETRSQIEAILGGPLAAATPILYGGSVKPGNATELLACPDIDGALVGGASLTLEQFGPILDAAKP